MAGMTVPPPFEIDLELRGPIAMGEKPACDPEWLTWNSGKTLACKPVKKRTSLGLP
jgi:hypothetical protein